MELAFVIIKGEPQFEQILAETLGNKFNESFLEFRIDSAEQHFAIALWAEGRFPPFGTKKDLKEDGVLIRITKDPNFLRQQRELNREAGMYYIGTPLGEKEIQATIKALGALGKELQAPPARSSSCPPSAKFKVHKNKRLHKRIRDRKE